MATIAEALAEVVLPSSCPTCGGRLPWGTSRAGVCASCWSTITPHLAPCCARCGTPGVAIDELCLACRETPPRWDALASYGPYEGTLRELILLLKYSRRDELAAPLAELLARVHDDVGWGLPDLVAPVPLSRLRHLRRGFNQAALLAHQLARHLRVPCGAALARRGAGSQVGRGRTRRLSLSSTSFRVRSAVTGVVLLVDDVITTGATARACTIALKRSGAAMVHVLALARTPTPGRIP